MDLEELVASLKRTVAAPGEYDTLFPSSTDDELSALLADAVAECQLDGFMSTVSLDLVTATTTPDLSTGEQALVVLYAAARVLTARISNLKNHTRYKAGAAEAETEQSASVLVELLRQTNARKRQITDDAKYGRAGLSFTMVDLYVSKSIDANTSDVAYISPGWM